MRLVTPTPHQLQYGGRPQCSTPTSQSAGFMSGFNNFATNLINGEEIVGQLSLYLNGGLCKLFVLCLNGGLCKLFVLCFNGGLYRLFVLYLNGGL